MNSFFAGKPQRKWTWASADGVTKNEIDYIITGCKSTVKNVTVLNNFSTGSDHRMVRARVTLNTRFQRSQLVQKSERIDVQRLYTQNEEFATKMTAELDNVNNQCVTLDELNTKIVDTIMGFMKSKCKSVQRMPDITVDEVKAAVAEMKNKKSPGEDGVPVEAIKLGGDSLLKAITALFNQCLQWEEVPEAWENAVITLLHKKGDITKLENYRPISLLSTLYKLFMKIITKRNTNKFDFYQPVEQAAFRSGFSTNDHLQVMRTLIEKCREYNIDIVLLFIDFEKAFDSVETWSILDALDECRVDSRYSNTIRYVYKNATSCIKLHKSTEKFRIGRGVRQGDTISPKLFTAILQSIFRKLNWSKMGIKINGEYLSNLRFADDIVPIAANLGQAQLMLQQLSEEASKVGLKMNLSKTKVMTNIGDDREIKIGDTVIERVDSYVYLGHKLKLGLDNQTAEIRRRIGLAWAAFGKLRLIFKSKMNNSLKRKVFDTCVLPVLTYGAETLTLTKASEDKLRVTQRAMERSMLGITLRDRMTNQWIRQQTRVVDVMERIASLKWSWAGHIARRTDERWTKKIMNWRPYKRRAIGRPPERWTNGIKNIAGTNWQQMAMDRTKWKEVGEAYIQQRIETG